MINRKNPQGGIGLHCDDCEKKFDTHHTGFQIVVNHALNAGWTITHVGSQYFHRCPECAGATRGLGT